MTDSAPFRNRPMFLHQITMTIAASLGLQVFRTLFDNSAMAIRTFFQKIGDPEDTRPARRWVSSLTTSAP